MASPSVTYTLANSTTADATKLNQNYSDLVAAMTDGTKSFSIDALTLAGAFVANGNATFGNATTDTFTVNGPAVFNETGANVDFRVEGDGDANLLFCDASADYIGVGTSSPLYKLDINGLLNVRGTPGTILSVNASSAYTNLGIIGNDIIFSTATTDGGGSSATRMTLKNTTGQVQISGSLTATGGIYYETGTKTLGAGASTNLIAAASIAAGGCYEFVAWRKDTMAGEGSDENARAVGVKSDDGTVRLVQQVSSGSISIAESVGSIVLVNGTASSRDFYYVIVRKC